MQPLDQDTQVPDLSFQLVTLAPPADVTAKPLDFDQDFLLAAAAITRRRAGHVAAVASAAIENLFLETHNLTAQCVDCLQQLQA
jgi:hypothetical protein